MKMFARKGEDGASLRGGPSTPRTPLRLTDAVYVFVLIALGGFIAHAAAETAAPPVHIVTSGSDLKWGPPPPMIPKCAEAAILDGDPFKQGAPFTVRLKLPDGCKFGPHWHPTDENVTVISGTLGAGMGDTFDPAKGQLIDAGGFVRMPTGMHHFAWAKGATIVQVHGVGPLEFSYVNPADDPRNQH